MAYQVIARKWRPMRFSDMVGQEHIARTLRNAIISGRIAQAYLFVGPRGIGKTTSARIFAKALNCQHPVDGEPCCECESCKSIANENCVDVIEIDAATHTQVEKAREICEDVMHLPLSSKYKIYIIDEVHMLSKSAWNALLKTIEEPPDYAKFIFATTEVNKVLPTVISRCQRFDLRRIPTPLIAERLEMIARSEHVDISPAAVQVIARAADGGMRDAQSLLDQMISFFASGSQEGKTITEEQALSLFGLTAPEEMMQMIRAVIANAPRQVILALRHFSESGKNLEILFDEILVWLRGVLMCSIMPDPAAVIEENPEKITLFRQLAAEAKPGVVQRLLEQFSSTGYLLREAINKQIFIETLLLKGMRLAHAPQAADILARLDYIRQTGELSPLEAIPSLSPEARPVPPPAVKPEAVVTPPPAVKPEAVVTPPPAVKKTEVEITPPPAVKPEAVVTPPSAVKKTEVEITPPPAVKPEAVVTPPPVVAPAEAPAVKETVPEETSAGEDDAPDAEYQEGDPDGFAEEDAPSVRIEKKSVEELRREVQNVPIIQDAVKLFSGSIADVHDALTENSSNGNLN